jgi:hypothetical protein
MLKLHRTRREYEIPRLSPRINLPAGRVNEADHRAEASNRASSPGRISTSPSAARVPAGTWGAPTSRMVNF